VLDTNGNGRRDEWVEPNQPIDPTKDKRIAVNKRGGSAPLTEQSGERVGLSRRRRASHTRRRSDPHRAC
jgi:hypothetical protein